MKFPLGRTVITIAAKTAIENAGQIPAYFLDRHVRGDWGNISRGDAELNDDAIKDGERIISAYRTLAGGKVIIITERDRSLTTILLPSEY